VSVLSCPRTLQLYHIESLHPPRYLDIPSYKLEGSMFIPGGRNSKLTARFYQCCRHSLVPQNVPTNLQPLFIHCLDKCSTKTGCNFCHQNGTTVGFCLRCTQFECQPMYRVLSHFFTECFQTNTYELSMFHRAFFNSIIDKHQHMHLFTFNTVLV
jgi:hypothetical protein